MNLALTETEIQSVRETLTWLRTQAEPESCILCDGAGNVVDQEGKGPWESALVTALAAGVYGASRELARILGQQQFGSVLNQGDNTNIFFQSVNEDLLLVVVFTETASTGMVKLFAGRAASLIRRALANRSQRNIPDDLPPLVISDESDIFTADVEPPKHTALRREPQPVEQV